MDDRRFDALVRSLAAGTNRRQVLRGLLAIGSGAIAGGTVLDAGAARRPVQRPDQNTARARRLGTAARASAPLETSAVPSAARREQFVATTLVAREYATVRSCVARRGVSSAMAIAWPVSAARTMIVGSKGAARWIIDARRPARTIKAIVNPLVDVFRTSAMPASSTTLKPVPVNASRNMCRS
jgi:hypothetical protein